jgi:hypothetical protein
MQLSAIICNSGQSWHSGKNMNSLVSSLSCQCSAAIARCFFHDQDKPGLHVGVCRDIALEETMRIDTWIETFRDIWIPTNL